MHAICCVFLHMYSQPGKSTPKAAKEAAEEAKAEGKSQDLPYSLLFSVVSWTDPLQRGGGGRGGPGLKPNDATNH